MNQRSRVVLIWLIGTVVFLFFPLLLTPPHVRLKTAFHDPFVKKETFDTVLLILFFYLNYFLLIPRLFFKRKFVTFAMICLVCLVLIALIPPNVFELPIFRGQPFGPFTFFLEHLRHVFFGFLAIFLFSLTLRIHLRWRKTEQEKLQTQLAYLKGQINPHFLFNTLNGIYYLAIEKSGKAPQALLQLSEMMRYVIDEASEDFVDLEKEINYVTNFIELQKLRLGETASLSYRLEGNMEGKQIAPLVLLPFIENAFKYGVNPEEPAPILVGIDVKKNKLLLSVYNKKATLLAGHAQTGLGLRNVKERLELIYPDRYELSVKDELNSFYVSLKIDLV